MDKVILTRMSGLNDEDEGLFHSLGYQTAILPLTEVVALPLPEEMQQKLQTSEWLFFTSQTPVATILNYGFSGKIAVIGEKTATAVRQEGYQPTFISSVPAREHFLSEWLTAYPEATSVFYPKSQLADEFFQKKLPSNITLTTFTAYENRPPAELSEKLPKQLNQAQAIYITSPSAWQRAKEIMIESFPSLQLIAIGETTRQAIKADGKEAVLLEDFIQQNRQKGH